MFSSFEWVQNTDIDFYGVRGCRNNFSREISQLDHLQHRTYLQLLLPPADVFKLPTQIERKEPSPPSEESGSKDFVESNESASKDIVERIESASKDIVEKRETEVRA